MAIKIWTKEFVRMIPEIFEARSVFYRAFGGVQVLEGVEAQEDYLELKISDTDVVVQEYNTGAAIAFGAGTGSTNRFGERKEIKSVDVQVAFNAPMAIHEGIDRITVNDSPEEVILERLALHATAWAGYYDAQMSAALSANATQGIDKPKTETGIAELFSEAYKHFVNAGVSLAVPWVAYVSPDIYDILIDSDLATAAKNADVNISQQALYHFKGFILQVAPEAKFQTDDVAYFAADNVGVAGVGVEIARTIDSEDFAGVALQGAGKLGIYVPTKNKVAILKAGIQA